MTRIGRLRAAWRQYRRGRLADSTGSNLIEAAIILPLLVLLTCGIAEFGLIFWIWLALQNGVSQATRHAVVGNFNEASIKQAMRDATPSLTIDDGAFAFSHMPLGGGGWIGGVGGPNDIGKVRVTYTWNVITPFIRPFFSQGKIDFEVESSMKYESAFQ